MAKKIKYWGVWGLWTIALSSILMEIVLRIYNPIPVRIKSGEIILPANSSRSYHVSIKGLDSFVVHKVNNIGFRGEDKAADFDKRFSIIAVGGSTTMCLANEEHLWTYLLGQKLKPLLPCVWINNAGIAGHSTFAHQLLLDNYIVPLEPDVVLFLIGINDVERKDMDEQDKSIVPSFYYTWGNLFMKNSEFINTIVTLYRQKYAPINMFEDIDFQKLPPIILADTAINRQKQANITYCNAFYERTAQLVATCKKNGIEPILITQPYVGGSQKDSLTGINLATISTGDTSKRNGLLAWEILEMYNDKTRQVAAETNTFMIDLAREMPKHLEYFHDFIHFSNKGNEKVSQILSSHLRQYWSGQKCH